MKRIKIRCSKLSDVTVVNYASSITDKQKVTLKDLLSKIELTPNQAKERDRLIAKRDAPPTLSEGGKTYVKELFLAEKSGYTPMYSNKYTEKGDFCEQRGIDQIVDYLGLPMVSKNETEFSNDYIKGTPDLNFSMVGFQMDLKCPYEPKGLEIFKEKTSKNYIDQQKGYNCLLGVDHAIVAKVLLNPPEHILQKEAWQLLRKSGGEEMTESFMNEVRDLFDFEGRMKIEDRIKLFRIDSSQKDYDHFAKCVDLVNEYYNELHELWDSKNRKEMNFLKELVSNY